MIKINVKTAIEYFSINPFDKVSWTKWRDHCVDIKNQLDPVTFLVNLLAHRLFFLAARCVVFTSSPTFKKKCDEKKLANSRGNLKELGGEEIQLTMPDGHKVSGMYLNAAQCLAALMAKGAERGFIPLADAKIQEVLWLPSDQQELHQLVERMGVAIYHQDPDKSYIELGIPQDPLQQPAAVVPGTLIYAPGSGHLFEFRRKTIGTFLLNYGMNILLFHYSGTGKSEGKISEQATYDNVESAYQYLRAQGIIDEKILGYGHCMGGGPILNLAAKHPINLLADRTYLTMGELAKRHVATVLHLPGLLHCLINWIEPVMNQCFYYNNRDKMKQVKGHVAVLGATQDHLIPDDYIQTLFDNAILAQSRLKLSMEANHDMNLFEDEQSRLLFGQFLTDAHLIGY